MAVTSFQRGDGAADGGCRGCSKMKAREQQDAAQGSPVWTLRDQDAAFLKALEKMPSATTPLEPSIGNTEEPYRSPPEHLHSLKHGSSVLALAVSSQNACIYAGTQDGEIVVWSLGYFEETKRIQAHKRSVLCLFLSPDESKLFSSAGDPIISVWCPRTFARLYEIYSTYDVGDIFSVAYSSQLDTLYLGAQDTSIQCVKLSDESRLSSHDAARHPDRRNHRFFDSKAVGGTSTPRRTEDRWSNIPRADKTLEIDSGAILRFAHYGYVYCMLMAKGPTMLVEAEEEVLISGGGDGTIKLWKLSDPAGDAAVDNNDDECGIREIMVLGTDDAESVMSLAVDASFLYAGKLKGLIELWDLDTKQKLRVIKAHKGDVMTLQMGWGLLWSAASVGTATTHTTVHYGKYQNAHTANVSQKYQCVRRWKAHHGKALASAVATYGSEKYYISGANDDDIAVWRVTDSAPLEESADEASDDVLIASLREFVSYKTVSSRPEFAEDCRKGATYLGSLFKKLGGQVGMLSSDKPHNPVVYAKFSGKLEPAEKRKRILFYGHYDVVTADTKNGKWQTDPFHAKGENGYLYGRGVSDNKGPILAALYATTDLMQAQKLDNDIIFLIEGEEESGSRGFEETVQKHKDLIGHIDYILLANSYWLDDEVPCLTYGLRGVLHATVCVDSDLPDLHSGVDGSAMMDEPLSDLTRILSNLKLQGNRVAIPGFYEHILPVTAEEEARYDEIARILVRRSPALRRSPEPERRDAAADENDADAARLKASLMARWREPNLTIHRYKVSGPDGSLVSSHASANISFRLVPGQAVDKVAAMAVAFLEGEFAALESRNRLSVKIDNKAEPWLGDPTNGIFRTLEGAVMEAWADLFDQTGNGAEGSTGSASGAEGASARPRRPLYIREGGSIPAIRFLEKEFGAPAAHLPCGQASDSAHLDNERLRVVNLVKSREIFGKVFMRL